MEKSKPHDLHTIEEEGKKGDSICYRCGNSDYLADDVDSIM